MRYQVRVTREITVETLVIVDAMNADEASDKASAEAQQRVNALRWETSKDRRDLFMARRDDVKPAPLTARARA